MMKKLILFTLTFSFFVSFSGCHHLCQDLEATIGTEPWYENLRWEDFSQQTFDFSGNTNFTQTAPGEVTAKAKPGYVSNYTLSKNLRDIKGFDADVKITSNAKRAGFQIYATNSYQHYEFYLTQDGKFKVTHNMGKTDSKDEIIFQKKIDYDKSKFHNVKAVLNSDRTISVYLDGAFMCKVPDHKMHYGTFLIASVVADGAGQVVTSYFKLHNLQH